MQEFICRSVNCWMLLSSVTQALQFSGQKAVQASADFLPSIPQTGSLMQKEIPPLSNRTAVLPRCPIIIRINFCFSVINCNPAILPAVVCSVPCSGSICIKTMPCMTVPDIWNVMAYPFSPQQSGTMILNLKKSGKL